MKRLRSFRARLFRARTFFSVFGHTKAEVELHATETPDTAFFTIGVAPPHLVTLHATEEPDTATFAAVLGKKHSTADLHATEEPDTASFAVHVVPEDVVIPPIFVPGGGGISAFPKPPKIKIKKRKPKRKSDARLHFTEATDKAHFVAQTLHRRNVVVRITEASDRMNAKASLGFNHVENDNAFLLVA